MINRYQLLITLLSLPIALYTLFIAIRHKDIRYLKQRLGFYHNKTTDNSNTIWIHAASVGELNAAIPLIQKFSIQHCVILTTNTPSSANRAATVFKNTPSILHYYCPIDWRRSVKAFIKTLEPQYLFIIETELWPNLFSICHSNNIPISIINGRISDKTLHAANWVRKQYKECLQKTSIILTRSEDDSSRFKSLGARPECTKTIGNIKYHLKDHTAIAAFSTVTPYVLAASTRDDEEVLLVSEWIQSQKNINEKYLFVITPRHPKRLNKILEQLGAFNLNIAVRSKNETITNNTDIYIADTFGELTSFIKGATFVIMGGSFVNKGGQNILEVAQSGKTVVFGRYMDNFKDEAKEFVLMQAGIQVEKINSLPETIENLLKQPEINIQFQYNAQKLIHKYDNILEDYISAIQQQHPAILVNEYSRA